MLCRGFWFSDAPVVTVNSVFPTGVLLSNSNGAEIKRAQPPHESELHHVGVHEQELHAAAADTSCNRLHGGVARYGVGGQEHVFQRTELWIIVSATCSAYVG